MTCRARPKLPTPRPTEDIPAVFSRSRTIRPLVMAILVRTPAAWARTRRRPCAACKWRSASCTRTSSRFSNAMSGSATPSARLCALACNQTFSSFFSAPRRVSWTILRCSIGVLSGCKKGRRIGGTSEAEKIDAVTVFHARTAIGAAVDIMSDGGQVAGVTATGTTIVEDLRKAYDEVEKREWEAGFWRTDIAWRQSSAKRKQANPRLVPQRRGCSVEDYQSLCRWP